jgi:hypothetical protein
MRAPEGRLKIYWELRNGGATMRIWQSLNDVPTRQSGASVSGLDAIALFQPSG